MTRLAIPPDIRFGVGGFPLAFTERPEAKDRGAVFAWLRSVGLDAIELQMTYGPRMTAEQGRRYRALAIADDIKLSIHGSYYIVLASPDPAKVLRSVDTLLRTYEQADILGAREIVLHPGSLYGAPEADVSRRFAENLERFMAQLGKTDISLMIETAGKVGQMGSVDMILDVASTVKGVGPCIDFGHVHARSLGELETPDAMAQVFARIDEFQRSNPDTPTHFHYTPIHFGPRGEIQHRALSDIDGVSNKPFHPRPEPVAAGLAGLPGRFTIISETHNSQEMGAIRLKKLDQFRHLWA
jgi:deoxyribonuclease-4